MDIQEQKPRLGWRIATVLGVIFGIYILAQDLDWLASLTGLSSRGDIGVVATDEGEAIGSGRMRVTGLAPGSPAAAAGIARGDILTFEPHWRAQNVPGIGERVEVTVLHDGAPRHVVLTAASSRAPAIEGDTQGQVLADLSDIPSVLLGLLILIRGRSRPAPVLLGLGMIGFGMNWLPPSPSLGGVITFLPAVWLNLFEFYLVFATFLAFALVLLDSVADARRWRWVAFTVFAGALAAAWLWGNFLGLGLHPPLSDLARRYHPFRVLTVVSLGLTLLILVAAWWRAPATEKHRIGLLAAAFACIVVNQGWFQVIAVLGARTNEHLSNWPTLAMDVLAGVVAPILFAYAILRHRVLDLGFALNRTLVYSVVSAILVGAFALSEWAVDHFVRIQGRETNALIDAAIALAVSLTFHPVRRFVEHAIEALFFRSWQEKAAALRKFVAEAGFITRREPLLRGFGGALARFSDGADCAIYLLSEAGDYRLADGAIAGAPKRIDPDDPALVTLRADHKPLNLADSLSALPAELAAPMVNRNEVTGVVLLGPKPAAAGYRPDEAELIGWAVTQVGLDLHALEVEQLQAAVRKADTRIEELRLALARPAT